MKNSTSTGSFVGALSALAFAVPCSAATLAFYDIESNTTTAAQSSGTGLTASAIDVTGADGTSGNFTFQGSSMPYWFSDNVNDDANIDASVTPIVGGSPGVGDILGTFSLTPDSGQQIELGTTDVFDIGVLAYAASGSYAATVRLFVASDAAFTNILATSTTITNNRQSAGGATLTSSNAGSGEYVGLLGLDNAVTSASTLYFGVAMVDNDSSGNLNSRFDGVGVYGTVSAIPEPSTAPFQLTITPATAPDTSFDLEWDSQAGKLYNVRTSTDLAGPIAGWSLVTGGEDIAATPPTNIFNVDHDVTRRFFAVEEFDAPPPPPIFATDFEENDGGFTVSTTEGSAWEWGTPDSNNGQTSPNDLVLTTGNSGTNTWATSLGTADDDGFYTNPTTTFLRSPIINLSAVTSAELTFSEAVDFASTDSAEVYVISDSDDSVIAGPIHTSSTGAIQTADWATANSGNPIALPAAALGQSIRIEWRFTGGTDVFLGWYIDDVLVTETTP